MPTTTAATDRVSILRMRTELTADNCEPFRTQAKARLDDGARDLVLDMSNLETIDSQGLETLLWLDDTCVERLGQVRLASCQEHIVKILEMTRLTARLRAEATVEAAIASLQ